jgi:pyruvate/2-oxoacid:ferredoxin oxidoreductase alpha subunit
VIEETVEKLVEEGKKVGMVKVRLYRPFDVSALVSCLPKTTKMIAALDRTKEPGALGEPLYQDVVAALAENRGRRHQAEPGLRPEILHREGRRHTRGLLRPRQRRHRGRQP